MPAPDLPLWAAVIASVCLLLGAALSLIGAIGLVRLKSFYERVHAPTLGATLGAASILLGSMTFFSVLESRVIVHEILLLAFMLLTTPVTLILMVRAALYRDRAESSNNVPPLV